MRRSKPAPNRVRTRSKQTVAEAPPAPVTISIVTYPKTNTGGPSVESDVDLIKSALLYADKVELISFGVSMLGSVAALADGGEEALLGLLFSMDDATISSMSSNKSLPPNWRELVKTMRLAGATGLVTDPEFVAMIKEFDEVMKRSSDEMAEVVGTMLETSGANELVPCLESGLLMVSDAGLSDGADFEVVMQRWTRMIDTRLRSPQTRLLFDDGSGDLVSSMLAEGQLNASDMAMRRIGKAAIGSGLVGRLPAFPQAPMNELLDLRSDLSEALGRYRRAVSTLAETLPAAVGPELEAAVDELWDEQVLPTIQEIDDLLQHHGLVKDVARKVGTDVRSLIMEGFGIYIGLAGVAGMGPVVSGGVGLGAIGTQSAVSGFIDSKRGKASAKANDLFYLYQANESLGR